MKKIYSVILAFATILTFATNLSAQRDVPYHEKGGVAYNKYITSDKPDADGNYTVHLETFTTGEVQVKKKSIPSDIVLVLDMSGSMNYDYKLSTEGEHGVPLSEQLEADLGTAANNSQVNYRWSTAMQVINGYNCINNTPQNNSAISSNYLRYYKDEDGFYQVTAGRTNFNTEGNTKYYYYYLYFKKNGTTYYLSNSAGGVTTTRPTDIIGTSTVDNANKETHSVPTQTIWTGQLWRYPSRIQALKEAIGGFVAMIAKNDREEVQPNLDGGIPGNQISIVRFTGNDDPKDALDRNTDGSVKEVSTNDAHTYVRKRFTTVKEDNGASIVAAMNSMTASGNTPHDSGVKLAQLLLEDLEANGMPAIHPVYNTPARHKTVVVFTDGNPEVSGRNAYKVTHDATLFGVSIKKDLHGQIFTVGFNPTSGSKKFLEYLSSEYPDGLQNNTSGSYNYTGTQDVTHVDEDDNTIFYRDGATSDLSKIFESIAEAVGGNSQEYGATSMVAVDIVSSSFQLPEGVDASSVKVYTAQCLGILDETFTPEGETEAKHYLAFAKPKLAPTRPKLDSLWVSHKVKSKVNPDADSLDVHGNTVYQWERLENVDIDGTSAPGPDNTDGIRLKINPADNSVSITGFDFSQCWCGLDAEHENVEQYDSSDPNYSHHVAGYRGFKLIIEFPIKITEDAVGGPAVNTNLPGSGLYMTDENGNKTGEPIIVYPAPTLLVPVNLWISKKGLNKGESASFSIERKLAKKEHEGDPDPEYEYFTNVMLTGKPGVDSLTVKLLNLDPAYFYRVQENGWSWSYDTVIQPANAGQTTETTTHNPFVFQNTKKENMPKHAESVVNNDFKNGQAVTTSSKDHTYTPTP